MIPARESLERLIAGNRRFVEDQRSPGPGSLHDRRLELVSGQSPFAVILGCSDSRAPAEIIFDQGLGDLFVVRVAGNVVAPSLIGSIEFAVERFGTRLVVVMGHTGCGAVRATLEVLQDPESVPSANLASIVDRIRPSIDPLLASPLRDTPAALLQRAVRDNVRASVAKLREEILGQPHATPEEELWILGAEYCLESGQVSFFDGEGAG